CFVPAWIALQVRTRQNMLTGQTLALLDMLNSWLPIYLMSGMSAGLVSALNYAKQFTDSTTEVLTTRAANIAKIEMTEQWAQKQYSAVNKTFLNTPYVLMILLAPLIVFSYYFAPYIVELFFKRGHFGAQATRDTVLFLRPLLLTLPLAAVGYVQNSALAAGQKIKEWFPYALVSGLMLTGMMWIIIPLKGAFAYPYLLGVGLLIGFVLNAFLFKKHLNFLQYLQPFGILLRLSALAILALLPAALLSCVLTKNCWVQIFGCGVVFTTAYVGILYLTKDIQILVQFFRNDF
ncbi:MAG: hypothetical protein IKW71_00925, partial [Elusimicrobiaceae bacterium]|nr:hypothetical protein [Elusimicrobiaceae bacterium]